MMASAGNWPSKNVRHFFCRKSPIPVVTMPNGASCILCTHLALSHDGKLPAIIEKGETLDVKLNCYLNLSRPDPSKTKGGQTTTRTGKSRSEVTLLGFLNICMQKSRMNTWYMLGRTRPSNFRVAACMPKLPWPTPAVVSLPALI